MHQQTDLSATRTGSPATNLLTRLELLAVFRALLDDPVIASLRTLLATPTPTAYGAFVSELLRATDGTADLAGYVRDAVADDENPYLRRVAAGEEVPAPVASTVRTELATLQAVCDLSPRTLGVLLSAALGADGAAKIAAAAAIVPAFSTNPAPGAPGHVDVAAAYADCLRSVGRRGWGMYARYHMFHLDEVGAIVPVRHPDATRLDDLFGYERQRKVILDNTLALLAGSPAANILLTGDAGTGKSATVKALGNELRGEGLRILEVRKDQLHDIPAVLDDLARNPLKFILFIDDLSFSRDDDNYAALKAILEGSVSAKSRNVVIYATSNRRHLVKESFSDREGDDVHRNDTMQETVSLSERFGLHVTFDKPSKQTYLEIVRHLADEAGLSYDDDDLALHAERFVLGRGGRSARAARQFVDSLIAARRDAVEKVDDEGGVAGA